MTLFEKVSLLVIFSDFSSLERSIFGFFAFFGQKSTPTHYKKRALLGPNLAQKVKNPDSPANFKKFAGAKAFLAKKPFFLAFGQKSYRSGGGKIFKIFSFFASS